MHEDALSHWLVEVFDKAGLARPAGGGWHILRRQSANVRKDAPVKDLMELGGWSQVAIVVGICQVADERTMRKVLNGR